MEKLGILGGMGPMAGAYFYTRVIANTASSDDRGHIPVILLGDPRIPDRTSSILRGDDAAKKALLKGIGFLERSGADLIAIPCNTAHAFLEELCAFTRLPILDMPRLCCAHAASVGHKRIGVLSTRGCRAAGVYERAAEQFSASTVSLSGGHALALEQLIYRQKAGEAITRGDYLPYADMLFSKGADCVVLACTEISCAFGGEISKTQIDALEILAKTAVSFLSGKIAEVEARAFL